jgi:hypothetical protein
MRKPFIAGVLALLAGTAWAFPADLEIRPKELSIGAVVHSDGRVAMVRVTNQEETALRCEAFFRNGPEQGRTRHAIVGSGDSTTLSWTPRREVVRLRIQLNCQPHEGGANGEAMADDTAEEDAREEDLSDTEPRIVEPGDAGDPPDA